MWKRDRSGRRRKAKEEIKIMGEKGSVLDGKRMGSRVRRRKWVGE